MKPIPLFGSGFESYSKVVSRQRRLNCMYDLRRDQDRAAAVVVNTPGSALAFTLPEGPVRAWHVAKGSLYVVAGSGLYRVSPAGVSVLITTLLTNTGVADIEDNGLELFIVDGAAGYYQEFSTGTIGTVTDVNFPVGATSVAFLNGRFVVNSPNSREFYASQPLSATNWTPQAFGTKENSSDLLLAVSVLNGVLILWGELSMEYWQDVGTLPLPYQRVNGATQTWGLAARQSYVEIANTVVFLGYSPDGGVKVMRVNGYTPEPISDSDVEYVISNLSKIDDAVALTYTAYGHPVYQITFPTDNRSFAYDMRTGVWHEAQTGTAAVARHFGNLSITFTGKNHVSDATTGNVYVLDEDVYEDAGTPIPREVCTRHIRADGNEVFMAQLMLDFETALPGATPTVFVSVSRDGGNTFGPEKQRSLGAVGQYLSRVVFNRLGRARDFVIRIRMVNNSRFVICGGSAVVEMSDG